MNYITPLSACCWKTWQPCRCT